eukprot:XP_011669717.1 PREDICTED: low-density lipoprotein receptor-related protein 4-like [Strongylocentrotus purpuratus]
MAQLWMIAVSISAQFISPSNCTDKMFVTETANAEIFMAEAIDYSFVNTSFIKIPLNGLEYPIGVEFDPRSELIYWTDAKLHTVNRAALDGSSQEVIAQLQPLSGDYQYPYGVALNLDDDKVYWTDQIRDLIEMANLDGTSRTVLLTTGFSYPNAIVYSSFRRKIFWTDKGLYPKIEMANPDGTERVRLLDGDLDSDFTDPTGICLDPTEQILYWTDTTENTIEHLDLNNKNRDSTNIKNSTHVLDIFPFGVAKYFEDIYFSDTTLDGVYVIDYPVRNVLRVNMRLPGPAEIHIYANTSCPGGTFCASTGTCVIIQRQPDATFRCICDEGYNGNQCELSKESMIVHY